MVKKQTDAKIAEPVVEHAKPNCDDLTDDEELAELRKHFLEQVKSPSITAQERISACYLILDIMEMQRAIKENRPPVFHRAPGDDDE